MPDQTPVGVDPDAPQAKALAWDDLMPYEQQQGGYWLYGGDPFGEDKVWVPVRKPQTEDTFAARFRVANTNLRRAQDALRLLDQEFREWRKENPGVPAN